MNQKEKAYILKRIDDISSLKIQDVRKMFITQGKLLSQPDKIKALKEGKFVIKEPIDSVYENYGRNYSWHEYIHFNDEVRANVDHKKQNELIGMINMDAQKLKDQVMLGKDGEETLEVLNEFANRIYK